jgi:hypothetical protein
MKAEHRRIRATPGLMNAECRKPWFYYFLAMPVLFLLSWRQYLAGFGSHLQSGKLFLGKLFFECNDEEE